jgi:hypothetical protein
VVKIGLILVSIILINGCSTKKEDKLLKEYNIKKREYLKLQKTEKVVLYDNSIVKAILTATYLNTHNKTDKKDETFIVGLYLSDEDMNNTNNIFGTDNKDSDYKLTLDGKEPIKVEKLNNNDKRLKKTSFISEWNSYYLVTYKHQNKKRLTLVFKSQQYGEGRLSFAKVAKYTLNGNKSIF